jgi:hypothetical protein
VGSGRRRSLHHAAQRPWRPSNAERSREIRISSAETLAALPPGGQNDVPYRRFVGYARIATTLLQPETAKGAS